MPFANLQMRQRSPRAGYVGEDVENMLLKLYFKPQTLIQACRDGHHLHRRDRQNRESGNPSITNVSRCAAGSEDSRGHSSNSTSGQTQASPSGVHPDRHDKRGIHSRQHFAGLEEIIERRWGTRCPSRNCSVSSRTRPRRTLCSGSPEDLVNSG